MDSLEGPTEIEFCSGILAEELLKFDIFLQAPLIKKSNGGIVTWDALKRQIEKHLHEKDAYVSLLIDYYGIKDSFNFPGWQESKGIISLTERWQFLCDRMKADILPELAIHFIPYIQMHEFESLLFSDIEIFKNKFPSNLVDIHYIEDTIKEFSNPEEINSRPSLAPSKRLLKAITGYDKVLDGNCIAMEIGLNKIMDKCPLFNQWVSSLKSI